MWIWSRMGGFACLIVAFACSSNEGSASNETDSGTGGTATAACTPGATRVCVGPGACQGGQACSKDESWGICDCGAGGWPGSGGAGGNGGSAGASGGSAGAGTDAGAAGDCNAASGTLDLHDAVIYDNPSDLADWPVTTTITALSFQYNGQDGVHVEFSKRDGPDRWPDIVPPGWDGPLQYTMGLAEYINGKWYASAAIQFWYGLEASGGNIALDGQVAKNWYYSQGWWGEMAGYQPKTCEVIGVFVVAGNLRHVTDGSQSPVKERSNVVLVPMPDVNGASYTFP
jgi:hypothetical protein